MIPSLDMIRYAEELLRRCLLGEVVAIDALEVRSSGTIVPIKVRLLHAKS